MRYLVGSMCVLALLVSPLSASAQDAEQGTIAEPSLPEPSSELAPEEPALRLKLDPAGVEVVPSRPLSAYRRTQLRRARIGLAASVIGFGGGVAMMSVAFANAEWGSNVCLFEPCPQSPSWVLPVAVTGTVVVIGGLTGMILCGRRLADQKKQLRWYAGTPESHYGTPRRVQWDVARSRVVF